MAELGLRHDISADQLGKILDNFSFAVSELNEYEKEAKDFFKQYLILK